MQQTPLMFLDIPCPHEALWTHLSDAQRLAVVDVLARLIAQAAMPPAAKEEKSDD